MPNIYISASLFALLEEPYIDVKIYALKGMLVHMDTIWPDLACNISIL